MFGIINNIVLPKTYGDIIKAYLVIFKENEKYEAYTIDYDLKILKGHGIIKNNNIWNYHNGYDNSELELYFIEESGHVVKRWWTISLQEVKDIQKELITPRILKLEEEILHLKNLL